MTRKELLAELTNLEINPHFIDPTPTQLDGVEAVRIARGGDETYFTASDVYDGGEWTRVDDYRQTYLQETFGL